MHVVIGGRGRLGSCLAKITSERVHIIENSVYSEWWDQNNKKKIVEYFEENHITHGTVFITSGVLDPARSPSDHEKINYLLPKNIIEAVNIPGIRIITFGTIMERLIGDKTNNPYIISKLQLGHFIQGLSSTNVSALHIRLHTLYGGELPPHQFMFLGQLLRAIHMRSDFKMTSGEQLREYHHLDDVAQAIFYLSKSNLTGITHLSHGKPIKLKDIAHHIFNHFDHLPLLHLNALASPTQENYDAIFEPGSYINEVEFRATLPGIIDYLEPFVAKSRIESSIIF